MRSAQGAREEVGDMRRYHRGEQVKRSIFVGIPMGILYVFGETMLRIWTPPDVEGIGHLKKSLLMGYSSFWMFLIGASFAIVLGALNQKSPRNPWQRAPYTLQVLAGWLLTVFLELTWGLVLNVWLGIGVWNYSRLQPAFFFDQVCLVASLLWLVLTPMVFWADDLIRHYVFDEPRPESFWSYFTDLFQRRGMRVIKPE
jgi:hypothetical protein